MAMQLFDAELKVDTARRCSIDHYQEKILTDLFRHMIGRRICEYFFYYIIFSGRQTFEEKLLFSLFAVKTVL